MISLAPHCLAQCFTYNRVSCACCLHKQESRKDTCLEQLPSPPEVLKHISRHQREASSPPPMGTKGSPRYPPFAQSQTFKASLPLSWIPQDQSRYIPYICAYQYLHKTQILRSSGIFLTLSPIKLCPGPIQLHLILLSTLGNLPTLPSAIHSPSFV